MSLSQQKEANRKRVRIQCPNCGYSWMYAGRLSHYATCPSCRRNVKIQGNKIAIATSVEADV